MSDFIQQLLWDTWKHLGYFVSELFATAAQQLHSAVCPDKTTFNLLQTGSGI